MTHRYNYDMQERLFFSNGHAPTTDAVMNIIKNRIPGCLLVEKAPAQNDRCGADYIVRRVANLNLTVDLKLRDKDWSVNGEDDLALETWSVIDPPKIGWTRDFRKQTDFVLWHWRDTGRFFLLPFPPLCAVFQKHWQLWRLQYKCREQSSRTWRSECVFVPRLKVIEEINRWSNGKLIEINA